MSCCRSPVFRADDSAPQPFKREFRVNALGRARTGITLECDKPLSVIGCQFWERDWLRLGNFLSCTSVALATCAQSLRQGGIVILFLYPLIWRPYVRSADSGATGVPPSAARTSGAMAQGVRALSPTEGGACGYPGNLESAVTKLSPPRGTRSKFPTEPSTPSRFSVLRTGLS